MRYYLLMFMLALFFPCQTEAFCQVPQPRLVCAEYFASRVVVEATLVRTRPVRDKDDPDGVLGFFYGLHADHILRGEILPDFRVYEGNDSGRATFGWRVGQKYLLFLFYSAPEKSWALDGCGNSGPLADAKAVLAQIDAINTHRNGGFIHGVVRTPDADTIGVRVEAVGSHGRYAATTNEKGEFHIEVPVGRYVVHAHKAGLAFRAADIGYENPNHVRIESGGCVQVQLEGE